MQVDLSVDPQEVLLAEGAEGVVELGEARGCLDARLEPSSDVLDDAMACDPVYLGVDARCGCAAPDRLQVRFAVLAECASEGTAALCFPADESLWLYDA